jgi:elongation factor P
MITATEIRVGDVIRTDGKPCEVLQQEIRGTGKFGKSVHLKLKRLEDGHVLEKTLRAEDKADDVEVRRVKMQYLYKDGGQFVFMNTETFEQFPLPAAAVGRQEVFLKENSEIDVLFDGDRALSAAFPKVVELKVTSAPPQLGGGDTTYKEAGLENGLKILVPQFVKEGEVVRLNTADLTYVDRVTTKSLKNAAVPLARPEKEKEEKP